MKMRRAISFVVATVFLLSQTLGVAGHCVVDKMASQHAHHHSADGGQDHAHNPSNGTADAGVLGSEPSLAHHVSQGSDNKPASDIDFSSAFGDCTMGFSGVESASSADIPHTHAARRFVASIGTAMTGSIPVLPTPPPNSSL